MRTLDFRTPFLAALAASTVTSGGLAQPLRGTDLANDVAAQVLANCPAAAGLSHVGGGSHLGEQAMFNGEQEIALMSRELAPDVTCASSAPEQAEGLVLGLDAVLIGTDQASAAACSDELANFRWTEVSEHNGNPGLQCPDCVGDVYVFSDWRDPLRVLLAGMSHDAGDDLGLQDCDSDLRHALASDRALLFGAGCSDPTAEALRHLFRSSDRSDASERLRQVLGLPETGPAFCNGTSYQDRDPIRRPCDPAEQVCRYDGTLGLVLPIAVPKIVPGAGPTSGSPASASEAVNPSPCAEGIFKYLSTLDDETGAPLLRCPNNAISVFGNCLTPQDVDGNFGCINSAENCPFGTPLTTGDCRGYTAEARKANGTPLRDTREAGEVAGAFYRLHTTTTRTAHPGCPNTDSATQTGCLLAASGASLGVGGRNLDVDPSALALRVEGIAPSDANLRAVFTNPEAAYPLTTKLTLHAMGGSEELQNPAEDAAWACFRQDSKVAPAVQAAGLVSLGRPPVCEDFDDRPCGNLFNRNNCIKGGINICPSLQSLVVSPLQVSVGGEISVSVAGFDLNNDPLEYAWTATAGEFADPFADSTTYTCTEPGAQVITAHMWDGRCETTRTADVLCVEL